MRLFIFLVLGLALGGCSNKQVYTAVQENRRQECAKLTQPQYEECMRELETSYEEYEEARQDVIKGESE